jgi:hypothetical protein
MALHSKLGAAIAAAGLLTGIGVWALGGTPTDETKPRLALFTSLPIYWAESDSIAETLEGAAAPHWARNALEADHMLIPLDTLDNEELRGLGRMVMAQPRPLAPSENVALDDWVRGGGRLLLFADPMLTEHSRFMLGDKRRPQDMVLLSPILRRWGLELEFNEDQPDAQRTIGVGQGAIPVRLAGTFRKVAPAAGSECRVESASVVARCTIGKGHAVIVADAAMLAGDRETQGATDELRALISDAFAN